MEKGLAIKFAIYLILVLAIVPCMFADEQVDFDSADVKYIQIQIDSPYITDFKFDLTGVNYGGQFPENITIDVADDGNTDWEYRVYHSNISATVDEVTAAFTDTENTDRLYIHSGLDVSDLGQQVGRMVDGVFGRQYIESPGNLGIRTNDDMTEQILSITTSTKTEHFFLPDLSTVFFGGLYLAEGGSSYYCHSDHEFTMIFECDLSPEDAMVPEHLAREATDTEFDYKETVFNPLMTESINAELESCSLPCDITIRVETESPGALYFENFSYSAAGGPANITLTDSGSNYDIEIEAGLELTEVSYFYGIMPEVHVIPVYGYNDNSSIDSFANEKYTYIQNRLAEGWDNLTNNSHPLNFTFYPPTQINYDTGSNDWGDFWTGAIDSLEESISYTEPAIFIIIDIKEYFSDKDPFMLRSTGDQEGIIGYAYINGFNEVNSITNMNNYDEILLNVFMHELSHAFIFYPYKGNLFYSDHPSSYCELDMFNTYGSSSSPSGNEGYFEPYSILSQVRPYILSEDIGRQPELSLLDQVLLGTLSPHLDLSYLYYDGEIVDTGNKLEINFMTSDPTHDEDVYELYRISDDSDWWDIRSTTKNYEGVSVSFSVPKNDQAGRALWVFAEDSIHDDHFKVFNKGAESISQISENFELPIIEYILPDDEEIFGDSNVSFSILASDYDSDLQNVSIYGNWESWSLKDTVSLTGRADEGIFSFILSGGIYTWYARVCDVDDNCIASENRTFEIDKIGPVVTVNFPSDGTTQSELDIIFRYTPIDAAGIGNCSLYVDDSLVVTDSTISSGNENSLSYTFVNGNYEYQIFCYDNYGNMGKSALNTIRINYIVEVDGEGEEEEDDDDSGSSGSGGGGGGSSPSVGMSSSVSSDNENEITKTWYNLEKDYDMEWKPNDKIIRDFRYKTESNMNMFKVTIRENIDEVDIVKPKKNALMFFSIDYSTSPKKDVSFVFRVNKTAEEDIFIRLSGYDDSWVDVPIELVSDDIIYNYYETSSLLSDFVIYSIRSDFDVKKDLQVDTSENNATNNMEVKPKVDKKINISAPKEDGIQKTSSELDISNAFIIVGILSLLLLIIAIASILIKNFSGSK